MTTPTPRTDAEALKWGPHEGQMNVVIPTSFARQLERELAAAQEALNQMGAAMREARAQRDAAQEALKAAEARAEEYRKDAERLDSVASEYFKIEPFAMSTWAGDADVGWCITKFYMAKPCERVVAEVFRDDPRAAIDAAMKEPK